MSARPLPAPFPLLALALCAALLTGCGGSGGSAACDPAAQTGCEAGLACEQVIGGAPACFHPLVLSGTVRELGAAASTPVPEARVVALDQERAPRSPVATSDAGGGWALRVPAARDPSGQPVQAAITLRADAQGYLPFPGGLRAALPIDLSAATHDTANRRWTLATGLTALELLPATGGGSAWLRGTVARPPGGGGALVVAEAAPGGTGPGTGRTAIADASGTYAIFNLAAGGSYQLRAYARGVNYAPATTAALAAGENAAPALAASATPVAAVAGAMNYNNFGGVKPAVKVSLVVRSTYDPVLDRGETPPGLTVDGSPSGYAFSGVPDGSYLVLAAFGAETPAAVRDPADAAMPVAVAGGLVTQAPAGFTITQAIDLTSIGGLPVAATPLRVASPTPAFVWQSTSTYSQAKSFLLQLFDGSGSEVWRRDQAKASGENSATYDGPALRAGMTYQLRILATTYDPGAVPVSPDPAALLSQTEDVLGVFVHAP